MDSFIFPGDQGQSQVSLGCLKQAHNHGSRCDDLDLWHRQSLLILMTMDVPGRPQSVSTMFSVSFGNDCTCSDWVIFFSLNWEEWHGHKLDWVTRRKGRKQDKNGCLHMLKSGCYSKLSGTWDWFSTGIASYPIQSHNPWANPTGQFFASSAFEGPD